jgi:ArsR family transcriptional regulator
MSEKAFDTLSRIFKALSDPTRLRIVHFLTRSQQALCVNAITMRLKVSQSAVSQHLRVLRQANMVRAERMGFHIHYSLNKETIDLYKTYIADILGEAFLK